MLFYDTRNTKKSVSLTQAVVEAMPQSGGLYMPRELCKAKFLPNIKNMSLQEIAFEISMNFLSGDLSSNDISDIVENSINFQAPLYKVENEIYSLELFHGPTLAFKDFGARYMAQLLSKLISKQEKILTIVVATSGDTGSAVANGFLGVEGIRVVILYPSGKVSPLQEKQLTTLGENIFAVEIDGDFDDCQILAKKSLSDKQLQISTPISSANSINIARLIPQSFYYFSSFAQLEQSSFWVSIPSGNFGNLTACVFAKKMGLPIEKIIAATNVNDVVPVYLNTAKFTPKKTIHSISSAMDVGNPSNIQRLFDIYQNKIENFRSDMLGVAFSDKKAKKTIQEVYQKQSYLMDCHGVFGYMGLKKFLPANKVGIFAQTAHPAKFCEIIEPIIGEKIAIPPRLAKYLTKTKIATKMEAKYTYFRDFLQNL